MRIVPLPLAVLWLAAIGHPAAAAPPKIGMNLDGQAYYSKSFPFIDRMKTADDWGVTGPATEPVELDPQGYLKRVPAGAKGFYTIVAVDPVSAGTSRRYVISWKGKGDFGFRGLAREVKRSPGRLVIEVAAAADYLPVDMFTDAADHMTDIHVIREDQVQLFEAGQVFSPEFLAKVKPFDTVRTMDWGRTNSADRAFTWANRPVVDQMSWSWAKGGGVPLEVQVRLANELGRNLWWNVPYAADDDYVRQAIRTIRDTLKPDLRLYVEWANEVWNWSFPVTTLADQAGKAMGLDGAYTYHGYRAAQVARLVREAWGADPGKRLHNVLATQTGWQGQEQYHIIPGVQKVGDPARLFDAYAITTYFYGPFDPQGAPAEWKQAVAWANGGDAGLTAFFAWLEAKSLPQLEGWLAYQGGVAKKYGWELVAYEGGQHLTPPPGLGDEGAAVGGMVARALDDPRMGAIYAKMVAAFERQGGSRLVAFNEAGKFWGALPDIYAAGSPRYDALVAAAKAGEGKAGTAGGGAD